MSFDLFINTSPGQLLPTHERKALFSRFLPETELDGVCDVNDLADDDVPDAFTLGCLERCFKNGVYDRGEFEAFCREKHLTPFLDAQESWKAACLFFHAKQGQNILAVKMPPWEERDDAREAYRKIVDFARRYGLSVIDPQEGCEIDLNNPGEFPPAWDPPEPEPVAAPTRKWWMWWKR